MTHHLTDKDTEARTAVCSIDGPVKIRPHGTGWGCAVRLNAKSREAKRRNPDRPRSSAAPHRLSWSDPETRTGICPVDGAVVIVPWGGGYVCQNRATELGVTNPQDEPQQYCRDCVDDDQTLVWLDAEGGCPRCTNGSLNAQLAQDAANSRLMRHLEDELDAGFTVVGINADPYAMPELESAVPGWQTIG